MMDNSKKSEIETSRGFWTTLPGVLTGIAGVIGAITALILGLKEVGIIGEDLPETQTSHTATVSPEKPSQTSNTTSTDFSNSTSTPEPRLSEPKLKVSTDQLSNSQTTLAKSAWEFMGTASTGESISVDTSSIVESGNNIKFEYRIGDELISAIADCSQNKWYAEGYDWYLPQSKATQDMLNFVCSF